MYELGLAHALCKPVVIIAKEGTKLPFDIITENTIFFADGPSGIFEIKEGLEKENLGLTMIKLPTVLYILL